ncbi:MAG: hypothetical protein ACOY0T_24470 [Myxococcota bacterium]
MALLTWALPSHADVPRFLAQQGRLFDANGVPLSGSLNFVFSLYLTPTGGPAVWSEQQTITLEDGYFSTLIGTLVAFDPLHFDGTPRYIGVSIGNDTEMTPRQLMVSVPYAMTAANVTGDINPTSIRVNGTLVVNARGEWVGPRSSLAQLTAPAWKPGFGLDGNAETLEVDPSDFMAPVVHTQLANAVTVDAPASTAQTVASATLTAPVAGSILASAAADVECALTASNASVELLHTLTMSSTAPADSASFSRGTHRYPSGADFFAAVNFGRFSAVAGAPTTIYWRAGVQRDGESRDACSFHRAKISLLFAPD